MATSSVSQVSMGTHYRVECYRDEKLVWVEEIDNLVVNTGLKYVMDRTFSEREEEDWYIGLCTNANVSPTDTAKDHQFVEFLGTTNIYRSEATFVDSGIVSGNKYTYVAQDVQQMITEAATLKGVFMTSGQTKGVDDGVLYGVASFPEAKNVVIGDALRITVTVSAKG